MSARFPWNCFITTKFSSEERVYGTSYNLGFKFRRWLRGQFFVSKDEYLGQEVNLTYPRVDEFVDLIKKKGKGCFLFKRDLSRVYRQIPIDLTDIAFVGYV